MTIGLSAHIRKLEQQVYLEKQSQPFAGVTKKYIALAVLVNVIAVALLVKFGAAFLIPEVVLGITTVFFIKEINLIIPTYIQDNIRFQSLLRTLSP